MGKWSLWKLQRIRRERTQSLIYSRIALLILAALGSGCDGAGADSSWRTLRFGETVGHTAVARESREVLRTEASFEIEVNVSAGCEINLGYASSLEDAHRVFRVTGFTEAGEQTRLIEAVVDGILSWVDQRYAVPKGGFHRLHFEIEGDRPGAFWSRPIAYCQTEEEPQNLKNVILVSLDTLRADRLGAYANPHGLTPEMDRIAAEGTLFEHAYASYPSTLSSHVSLFTGFHPTQHGILSGSSSKIPTDAKTLARAFSGAGYQTAAFTENAYVASGWGFAAGFDRYHDGADLVQRGEFTGEADKTFSLALDWLETRANAPFFLFVHTYKVHNPYNPTEEQILKLQQERGSHYRGYFGTEFNGESEIGFNLGKVALSRRDREQIELLYDAEVVALDAQVGRLQRTLEKLELADDTLLVLISDHGEEFFQHGFVGHGKSLHQQVLRVPMILRLPNRVPAGRRISDPVGLIDLGPTISELAGIGYPYDRAPARSLVNEIMGTATGPARPVFSELRATSVACEDPRTDFAKPCPYDAVSVREGSFGFIHRAVAGSSELFNYEDDPEERSNVARRRAERTAYFESLVSEYRSEVEATKMRSEPKRIDPDIQEKLKALGYVE